jgi:hypothetical protein
MPKTDVERKQKSRAIAKQKQLDAAWILDMETDPFDNVTMKHEYPFCVVLYSYIHPTIKLWKELDETDNAFTTRIIETIKDLPGKATIYAHNGGKFDWMLLAHHIKSKVMRKGGGIMAAKIGRHEIRDSRHIYPAALAAFSKMKFDYSTLTVENRQQHRAEIEAYCESDCQNLLKIVRQFIQENGSCISIGQAANRKLKKFVPYDRLSEHMDGKIRGVDTNYYHKDTYGKSNGKGYFFGGRVECLSGKGTFTGDYALYDVNSMYPSVMAECMHPIGNEFRFHTGEITDATCFVHLRCRNHGALLQHCVVNGIHTTSADVECGEFHTTIHEYLVAMALHLIEDVKIIELIDCDKRANFRDFVEPLYAERAEIKDWLDRHDRTHPEYIIVELHGQMIKLYLNNAYGKFAQNPRRFWREWWLNEDDPEPEVDCSYVKYEDTGIVQWRKRKDIWDDAHIDDDGRQIPGQYRLRGPSDQYRFHNVATAASITGAARAKLLWALYHAIDPVYCDTDSIICRSLRDCIEISPTKLGTWKKEKNICKISIAGKKLYCYTGSDGKSTVRSKGVDGLNPDHFPKMIDAGDAIRTVAKGPTLQLDGRQIYQERWVRATAQDGKSNLKRRIDACQSSLPASHLATSV